jgi:hypothetical protein
MAGTDMQATTAPGFELHDAPHAAIDAAGPILIDGSGLGIIIGGAIVLLTLYYGTAPKRAR